LGERRMIFAIERHMGSYFSRGTREEKKGTWGGKRKKQGG